MSYRIPWSKTFFADEFTLTWLSGTPPKVCSEHLDPETGRPRCLRARFTAPHPDTSGRWDLAVPINLPSVLPGTKRKILSVSSEGWYTGSYGFDGGVQDSYIRLLADGIEIFKSPKLRHSKTQPAINAFPVNKEVNQFSNLNFRVNQHVRSNFPSVEVIEHDMMLKIDAEYYTTIPPERANVTLHVLNSETGKPINEARVTLKSGAVIVADGYTNNEGTITFTNIVVGSYTLRIQASGYNLLEQSIDVIAPSVEYDAQLVPIPAPPLEWWVLPAVVGSIGIGGLVLLKGKPTPPIMVVR